MIVFGGQPTTNQLWALDLSVTPAWSMLAPSGTLPPPRADHVAIYDPVLDRMIIHGGDPGSLPRLGDVWALGLAGGGVWSELATSAVLPPASFSQVAVYDTPGDRTIVFGGSIARNDVWELRFSDTPGWGLVTPSGVAPSGRVDHAGIYDPMRHRMVFFGGFDGSRRNDVWELSLSGDPAWSEILPLGAPPAARSDHTAVYDPARDRMIVFGGLVSGYVNDVWALSFSGSSQWTQLSPTGVAPSSRGGHAAIWDPVRDRMIVFGGVAFGYQNDVWELSFSGSPHWAQLAPGGTPPAGRYASTALYDPVRDRMIVYGGRTQDASGSAPLGDVWELSLSGSPVWTPLAPSGAVPFPRWNHSAVYDSLRDRMVIFAGEDPSIFGDTWGLSWGNSSVSVQDPGVSRMGVGPLRPNPSRGRVEIDFELPRDGWMRLEIYDLQGRRVTRIAEGWSAAGRHTLAWPGTDDAGRVVPAGVYLIRLEAPGVNQTRRAVLVN